MFKLTLLPRNSFCPRETTFQGDECGISLPGSGTKSLTLRTCANLAGASGDRMGRDCLWAPHHQPSTLTSERSNLTMLGCFIFIETNQTIARIVQKLTEPMLTPQIQPGDTSTFISFHKGSWAGRGKEVPPTHRLLRRELCHFLLPCAAPHPSHGRLQFSGNVKVVKK